jgi:hypothetical protein
MISGTWILCLYPRGWRQRYEDEMLALLEQHTVTLATYFDLLIGALDAQLDPSYRTEKSLLLFKDKRTIATTFLCSYAIFLFTMYNWHHYIPLSLSLTPYYLDMSMLSTQSNLWAMLFVPSFNGLSSDALLATSDFLLQITLLITNLFFILLLVKQAKTTGRKRFIWPALLCLFLLLTLPLIPLFGVSAPTVALTNNSSWAILSIHMRPITQISVLYLWSVHLFWPLLPLLLSSLFIALVNLKGVMKANRRHWLLLALMFYLILPLGRMLWLNSSVEIPSTLVPISSIVLGDLLTYFPPFVGLATLLLALANHNGSARMWKIAIVPATFLSIVMLTKLFIILTMLPLLSRSLIHPFSPWLDNFSAFTLTSMLLMMFLSAGIAFIALLRGVVALKTIES